MKSSDPIHRTLVRQLRRLGIVDPARPPGAEEWAAALEVVSRTYAAAEEDRYLLERSLDISSREMEALNEHLRLSSETRVAAERDRLRSIIEALDDGLCVVDVDGKVTGLSGAGQRMLGVREDEALGAFFLDRLRLRGDDVGEEVDPRAALRAVLKIGHAVRYDNSDLLRDGRPPLPVSAALSPLVINGRSAGCVVVFRDMSAIRRAELELRQLNDALTEARDRALDASRAKSSFLANISHELRTPLNAIIGYSELIAEEGDGDDAGDHAQVFEDNQRIQQAARHLLSLINDVLDVSKIEAGKMEVEVQPFDVRELLSAVVAVIEPLAARGRNTLEVRCVDAVDAMVNDRTKLQQALFNLLSNAAKFTEGGRITLDVDAEIEDGVPWLTFEVRDTGIGIPADRLHDLFSAFTQVDASISRRYGGTGLGLTITREFCRMMGGDVEVASELGRGSLFRIRVPKVLRPPTHRDL